MFVCFGVLMKNLRGVLALLYLIVVLVLLYVVAGLVRNGKDRRAMQRVR
jgi:uncharacterized membrane protein